MDFHLIGSSNATSKVYKVVPDLGRTSGGSWASDNRSASAPGTLCDIEAAEVGIGGECGEFDGQLVRKWYDEQLVDELK